MEFGRDIARSWKVLLGSVLLGAVLFFALGVKLNRLPLRLDAPFVVAHRFVVTKTNGVGMVTEREVSRGMSRASALALVRHDLSGALGTAQFDVRAPEDGVIEVVAGANSETQARAAEKTVSDTLSELLYYYELQGDQFELRPVADPTVVTGNAWGFGIFAPRLVGFAVLGVVVGALFGAAAILLRKAFRQTHNSADSDTSATDAIGATQAPNAADATSAAGKSC